MHTCAKGCACARTHLQQLCEILHVLGLHLRQALRRLRHVLAQLVALLGDGIEGGHGGRGRGHQLLGGVNDGVVVGRDRHDLHTRARTVHTRVG